MIVTFSVLLLVLPLLLFGLRSLWNVHWNGEYYGHTVHMPELVFANAPEGTVYIDPLVRLDAEDRCYTVFTEPPQKIVLDRAEGFDDIVWKPLNIGENSEIARFYEDGYISLSMHYESGGIIIDENGTTRLDFYRWTDDERIDTIFARYGGMRAAYVDENGNVLGVTEPAKLVCDDTKPAALLADGSSLTLRVSDIPKWQNAVLNVIIIAEPCVFGALIAAVTTALIRRTLTKGELDNTENWGYN